ncbi:MAG: sigma 54-interacting transcriptional regulator [Thermoanaerobaculia bacterium]
MIETTELLQSYVHGIRSLSGARSVSLYVPASLSGLSQPFLIHDGEDLAVPELADLETADAFAAGRTDDATGEPGTMMPSADPLASLLPLPAVESFWSGGVWPADREQHEHATPSRRRSDAAPPTSPPSAWLGFRFADPSEALGDRLKDRDFLEKLAKDDPLPWWEWLFALGGALASHASQVAAILKDPITGFPDRTGFQAILTEELEKARRTGRPLSLLLINPDEFATINERFGREAGDSIIHDVSRRLRSALRSSDPIARYGGVIFAAILSETNLATAREVAGKVLESIAEESFLDGAVRLGFSIGVAVLDGEQETGLLPLELVRRADQALNAAKRLGGGCLVDWEERSGLEESGAFDRLSGIFTGNLSKDYRNMVLIWDTIDVIALNQDFDGLCGEVAERLYGVFKPNRIGVFSSQDDGSMLLTRGFTRRAAGSRNQQRVETVELSHEERNLLRLAVAAGEPREGANDVQDGVEEVSYAVPLRTSGASLGALFLAGDRDLLVLESSDLGFLKALAGQLAVALDRARLSELDRARQEGERRQLKAELKELRQALQQAKLVYRSPEMEDAVGTARRVAPTDATVLITGESGTGKELLARTVHELSSRRDRPFVIVDCGSIATTLIESELFGHEKGAYTGAQVRRRGQLAEADTGTVFLDEIAELPLEVQSKLLRFVQEKQFSPVGGSRVRKVDVRIVAATNRDLSLEVAAGRFREDLYYRLNVVRIEVPPLRQRPVDVLHLARHFLDTFTVQYQKSIRRFTPAAEDDLVRYTWPGNVRELQNRIMQAVILCDGDDLDASDLDLPTDGTVAPIAEVPTRILVSRAEAASRSTGPTLVGEDCWSRLREALGREVDLALGDDGDMLFPLGTWIREDLILAANDAARGVARRAASLLGIPETTFRRRLSKTQRQQRSGLSPRSGRWVEIRSLLAEVVSSPTDGEDLIRKALTILLEEILQRLPDDVSSGAQLLGVTAPTFRTRTAELTKRANSAAK